MQSLNEIAQNFALHRIQRELRREDVLEQFTQFIDPQSFNEWHLSLYRFGKTRPLLYFRLKTVSDAFDYFDSHSDGTLEALIAFKQELTHAILSLVQPGSSWDKEETLTLDRSEFDSTWHPEYQRYCEHILNHLIQIPLHVLQVQKTRSNATQTKNYTGQRLSNRVKLLRSNNLQSLTEGFDSVIRNAISHGQVQFGLNEVVYLDENATTTLNSYEITKAFDDLVDTCSSIVVALILFICKHKNQIEQKGMQRLPMGLRFFLIDGLVSTNYFSLNTMMESLAASKGKQLNISAIINTKDRSAQLLESIIVCWHAAKLSGLDYQRYAVSLDCGAKTTSSLFIDGKVLSQAIISNWMLAQCIKAKMIEAELLWFDVPRVLKPVHVWQNALLLSWERSRRRLISKWWQLGLKILSSRYTIRHVFNRSADKLRRIEAWVVFHGKGQVTDQELHEIVKDIISRLKRHRIKGSSLRGKEGLPAPPKYVWVKLYANDRRIRSFEGWKGGNLILMAEWHAPFGHKPIFVKNPDAIISGIRIKYNDELVNTHSS